MQSTAPVEVVHTWHPLVGGCAPRWASGWGEDKYGPFVDFTVRDVEQRLRWVPRGSFRMGSPDDEPGRWDEREGPQHTVTISQGFWLFDTPCTQALWEAVMSADDESADVNPSRFKSPDRPVEQVTWHDCRKFSERLEQLVSGLTVSLPTEAEWEHACRAGTSDATCVGSMEILGTNNAPILDGIAWYGGNCGVGFELDEEGGFDMSSWSEKQHEFKQGGSRAVAQKEANPWGLYDMLGNVWEWCRDGHRDYHNGAATDPIGPTDVSAYRVIRGGSWDSNAQYVRAAYRYWYSPVSRILSLGFRCRVQ